jgi:hypothetical protein
MNTIPKIGKSFFKAVSKPTRPAEQAESLFLKYGHFISPGAARMSGVLPETQRHRQAGNYGDAAADEHPDGFVSRRSGKEPGNVGAEGVCGVDSNDDKDNSANQQG